MKRDNLEQFIHQNRDAFDDALPSLKVWAEIDRALNQQEPSVRRGRPWRRYLAIAASVVLLVLSGVGVGVYLGPAAQSSQAVALSDVAPQYAGMERQFQQQIDQRLARLARYGQNEAVVQDLEQLDKVMKELQAELQYAPKGQEQQIVENLMRTYQAKIAILERVLQRLQEANPLPEELPKSNNDEVSI